MMGSSSHRQVSAVIAEPGVLEAVADPVLEEAWPVEVAHGTVVDSYGLPVEDRGQTRSVSSYRPVTTGAGG